MGVTLAAAAWVAAGSAAGGMARYWLSGLVARRIGETFPWGTLAVNASGAFVIGLAGALGGALAADGLPAVARSEAWLLGVVGFLGSYTTVSSFSLQTLTLLREGEALRAAGNVVASVGLCLGGAALGLAAGAWWIS